MRRSNTHGPPVYRSWPRAWWPLLTSRRSIDRRTYEGRAGATRPALARSRPGRRPLPMASRGRPTTARTAHARQAATNRTRGETLTQRTYKPLLLSADPPIFLLSFSLFALRLGTLEKAATRKYVKLRVRSYASTRCQSVAIPSATQSTANPARSLRPAEPGAPPPGSTTNESASIARAPEAAPANSLWPQKLLTAAIPNATVLTCQSRRAVLGSMSRAYRVVGQREFPRTRRFDVRRPYPPVFCRADSRRVQENGCRGFATQRHFQADGIGRKSRTQITRPYMLLRVCPARTRQFALCAPEIDPYIAPRREESSP